MTLERTYRFETDAGPDRLYGIVADLGRYPDWLDLVAAAVPVGRDPGDAGPAWRVDLRGRLGPLARRKRLRMVRDLDDADRRRARFVRRELDGRDHSEWTLTAVVVSTDSGSTLEMTLFYGGGLFGGVLGRVLDDVVADARPRLDAVLRHS